MKPYWLTKRNIIITLILGLFAAVFAMRTAEDRADMDAYGQEVVIYEY